MAVHQHLSISDPRFNIREIVKQMILLEQHLCEKDKYCPDCISKHMLTIEALAEEAQGLDSDGSWSLVVQPLVGKSRVWSAAFAAGVPARKIGQDVRAVRKQLAPRLVAPVSLGEDSDFSGFTVGRLATVPAWVLVLAGAAAGYWISSRA